MLLKTEIPQSRRQIGAADQPRVRAFKQIERVLEPLFNVGVMLMVMVNFGHQKQDALAEHTLPTAHA